MVLWIQLLLLEVPGPLFLEGRGMCQSMSHPWKGPEHRHLRVGSTSLCMGLSPAQLNAGVLKAPVQLQTGWFSPRAVSWEFAGSENTAPAWRGWLAGRVSVWLGLENGCVQLQLRQCAFLNFHMSSLMFFKGFTYGKCWNSGDNDVWTVYCFVCVFCNN